MEHARRRQIEPYVTRDDSTIVPGTAHKLFDDGEVDLVVICACAARYSHEHTVLLEEG
jgi:mannose-6-phosphate isomerase-like protein (cupin superfamily)